MKVYYNTSDKEYIIHSDEIITKIEINGVQMDLINNEKVITFPYEKTASKTIKVNEQEVDVIFQKLINPFSENAVVTKNLNGTKLIKLFNNPYVAKYKLTGKNMKVGVVDGGAVYKHYEFSNLNRVVFQNTTFTDQHSTHVCGTICANGYNPAAKGCAPECLIYSYNFNNYINSIISLAKTDVNSINNSYGFSNGWEYGNYYLGFTYEYYMSNYKTNPSLLVDKDFGKYTIFSNQIDTLVRTYPKVVLCFAAGNDRNDGYSGAGNWYVEKADGTVMTMNPVNFPPPKNDGNFDCVGTLACAKNVITVGATLDTSITTASFSSWGPTDDLRIKPDVVTNGDNVFSTSNTGYKQYITMSGTSMATPFATGCCILIQQFIKEQLKYFPVAATTKAILIHGATATTINGKNGYGLVDMNKSLKFLDNIILKRSFLYNDILISTVPIKYTVNYTSLVVTLCWSDIPGSPNTGAANNTAKSIINQIGLYVQANNQFYYPYRLEAMGSDAVQKQNATHNAALMVNYDNVQKIVINTVSGNAIINIIPIKITGVQRFSVCISPLL